MPIMAFISLIFVGIYFNKKKVVYITLVVFYIISTPFFSKHFFKIVEGQYNSTPLVEINKADAIVVLGGTLKINEFGINIMLNGVMPIDFLEGLNFIKQKNQI